MVILSAKGWWSSLLARHGLSKPDGRAVYRYKISDIEYESAKALIRQRAPFLNKGLTEPALAAVLVCYCAEHFKRENVNTTREWAPLLKPVGIDLSPNDVANAIQPGLTYLGRKVVRRGGAVRVRREWLLTLALQAGLPVRLLTSASTTWLTRYLENVLCAAFQRAYWNETEALLVAHEHATDLTPAYRDDDDFIELVAELALVMRKFRDSAPPEVSRGPELILWLDQNNPCWRNDIPMVLGDEAATKALDGLVRQAQAAAALNQGTLRAIRFLSRRQNIWSTGVRLEIGGSLNLLNADPEKGRLRLWPTGPLSNIVLGDIGIANPPISKSGNWLLKSSVGTLTFDHFALNEKVGLECRGASLSIPIPLPLTGGDPIRGEVTVFEGEASTFGELVAEYVGTGSVASRCPTLLVVAPADAQISFCITSPEGEAGGFEAIGYIEGLRIWKTTRSIYVHIAETDSKYRIDPASDPTLNRLRVPSAKLQGWFPADQSITVVNLPLKPEIIQNSEVRYPKFGEVEWRSGRTGAWTCIHAKQPDFGQVRLRWRDALAGVTLQSYPLFTIPDHFRLHAKCKGSKLTVNLQGDENQIHFEHDSNVAEVAYDGTLTLKIAKVVKLKGFLKRGTQSLPVVVNVKQDGNIFVDKEGRALLPKRYVWSEIQGGEAIAAMPGARVTLTRLDKDQALMPFVEEIGFPDGQLTIPMNRIARKIEHMRSVEGSLDSIIRVTFDALPSPYIDVAQFGKKLARYRGSAMRYPSNELLEDGGQIVFRPLVKPEHEFVPLGLKGFEFEGERVFYPPSEVRLPALVYVRRGNTVLTRPQLIGGNEVGDESPDLIKILVEPNRDVRLRSLRSWYDAQPLEAAAELFSRVVASLNGLPAASLDILLCAPSRVLVMALLQDEPAEREVFSLENQLPISWLFVPAADWHTAIATLWHIMDDKLSSPDTRVSGTIVMSYVQRRLQRLVDMEPCLDALFCYLDDVPWTQTLAVPDTISDAKNLMQSAAHDHFQRHSTTNFDGAVLTAWRDLPELAACSVVDGSHGLALDQRLSLWELRQLFPQPFQAIFSRTLLDLKAKRK